MMDYAISVRLLLDTLTDGRMMRKVVGRLVQVMAFAIGFALLLSWIGLWYAVATLSPVAALALTFTQIMMLAATIKAVQIFFARGEDICRLGESDFTMMAIFATLVRLPGEAALAFFALMSLPALLLVWAGAGDIIGLFGIPVLATAHWAIAGVVAMITCWIVGFASFVVFSLIAEAVSALYAIAHDLRRTRQHLEDQAQSGASLGRLAA